ncbi:hypothetical protein [Lignipirellula cremea]|uniref:Double zinc ribbon n=1 Tax=Lignipirellula cremea TaxID=2528010 RepID=A0A518E2H5_9BACT|nr:hypothetical protein [Lignipirellula cremea]QDU98274.1 Double zinc ribbon [Lignipirellula cremea]
MTNWKCATCQSEMESGFEVCWSCGTTVDGAPDPDFVREVDVEDRPEDWVQPIHCESCGYRGKALMAHPGYQWWTIPAAILLACTGIGFIFWIVAFAILVNRTYVTCPECGSRDRLINLEGTSTEFPPESEQLWKEKQEQDLAAFKRNKLIAMAIATTVICFLVGIAIANWNRP